MKGKILSLDYGRKNIGISLSDTTHSIAFIRDGIINNQQAIQKLNELIQQENVTLIIYGRNLNPNPNFNLEEETEKFLSQINKEIPIQSINEDYSTFEAIQKLKNSGYSQEQIQKLKDSASAQFILEKYLQSISEC